MAVNGEALVTIVSEYGYSGVRITTPVRGQREPREVAIEARNSRGLFIARFTLTDAGYDEVDARRKLSEMKAFYDKRDAGLA